MGCPTQVPVSYWSRQSSKTPIPAAGKAKVRVETRHCQSNPQDPAKTERVFLFKGRRRLVMHFERGKMFHFAIELIRPL